MAIAADPSPTADATRFMLPLRMSPTANTPGRLVSKVDGDLGGAHRAAARSSGVSAVPVLTKPLASSATHPWSHAVLGVAPVIRNTWRISCVSIAPVRLSRHWTDLN